LVMRAMDSGLTLGFMVISSCLFKKLGGWAEELLDLMKIL
jgi:hypothetical protein